VPAKSESGLIPAVLVRRNPWHPTKKDAEVILSRWFDKWALLDPNLLSFEIGKNWSFTVPPGEYRYVFGSWETKFNHGERMEIRKYLPTIFIGKWGNDCRNRGEFKFTRQCNTTCKP